MSIDAVEAPRVPHVRSLLLIWQNPRSRRFVKVGRLQVANNGYRFEYLEGAEDPEFQPLQSFPDFQRAYVTPQLPVFFQNRVMSRKRPSYEQYAHWLGLDPQFEAPIEFLARTGGGRATDTFHVVEEPRLEPGQVSILRFFASGLSHVEGSLGRLLNVRQSDRLTLRPEPDNPVNQRALLIDATAGESLGWVPDWLLEEVHVLMRAGDFRLFVDQVNFDAPWHLKLLCRLEATCL